MRRRVLPAAAAAAAAVLSIDGAAAAMVIRADPGGPIGRYEQRYAAVRASGDQVVIDGSCFSACTIVLGLVPRERVCVTPRARLGFHAAWFPDMAGGRVMSAEHTRRLAALYPEDVRRWLMRRGGLSARLIVMEGRELRAFLPACRQAAAQRAPATSRRTAEAGHNLEFIVRSQRSSSPSVTE